MNSMYRPQEPKSWISPSTIVIAFAVTFVLLVFGIHPDNHLIGYLAYANYKLYKEGKLASKKSKGRKNMEHWSID